MIRRVRKKRKNVTIKMTLGGMHMNEKTTGLLIAKLRKEKGMTQKQLADILHVSDKAVSRWETGLGYPDTSILSKLAKVLNVSVDELLSGEKIKKEIKAEEIHRPVFHPLTKTEQYFIRIIKTFSILALLWGICIGYDEIENMVIAISRDEYYWKEWISGIIKTIFYFLLSLGLWKLAKKAEFRDVDEYNKAKQDSM